MISSQLYRLVLPLITGLPSDAGMYFIIRRTVIPELCSLCVKTPSVLAMIGAAKLRVKRISGSRNYRCCGKSSYSHWGRFAAFAKLVICILEARLNKTTTSSVKSIENYICEIVQ